MPLSMVVISEGLCTCISVGLLLFLLLLLLRVNFEVEEAKAVIGLLRVVRASQVGKVLTGRKIPAWRTMPHSKARERAASF